MMIVSLDVHSEFCRMAGLYRRLDALRRERVEAYRRLVLESKGMPVLRRLQGIPGIGPRHSRTVVAWIVDPRRFRSRSAISSHGGLGLGQGFTNWRPVGRARASRRGLRELKRALFPPRGREPPRPRSGSARRPSRWPPRFP